MESRPNLALSVVIPCYQEVERIEGAIAGYLQAKRHIGVETELIIVDDGSTDGTGAAAIALIGDRLLMRCLSMAHLGKGGALKAGISAARGRWVIIADADWSMSPDQVASLFCPPDEEDSIESPALRIASREHPDSIRVGEPLYRHLLGRAFNHLVRLLLVDELMDTQCGFKGFSAAVGREICAGVGENGWAFDVEFLMIANRLGYRVEPIPIRWVHDSDSRVRAWIDSWTMGWALLGITRRHGSRMWPRQVASERGGSHHRRTENRLDSSTHP
jgi:dolichyl-phosphate beta-glucosyltransferase